jgi:D-alanyl-D-alanine carboxypeptidase (penicillin-binding protein 5/6)
MTGRRILAIILLIIGLGIAIMTPIVAFTPVGNSLFGNIDAPTPTPTVTPLPSPKPTPPPKPILTVVGTPPTVRAKAAYLLDANTGHTLDDFNGEVPLPMASTTKIMTAVIAIQSGNLDRLVTIDQDAKLEVANNAGSSAFLVSGDQISLKNLLYGLLLPSGDDAAIAIADAVAGSPSNFVTVMNFTAYKLRLFQTHYTNPDGLTYKDANGQPLPGNYTTAYDLTRLAQYAMQLPLFATIVKTSHYFLPANAVHHAYTWTSTNELLSPPPDNAGKAYTYTGATGIKTGFTGEAGYCLVFSATRAGHVLIGVVLFSSNSDQYQRFRDAKTLLNWGFGLPLRVPVP